MTQSRTATPGRIDPGLAAQIRRRYERARLPVCSTAQAREDVLALLEERKTLRRAGERLMMAALPYTGDAAVKAAVDEFRAVIEGRAP